MAINWYPGHMKKTNELIKENLKLVDLVIEILDARIPESSKNPILKDISINKGHIIILNKSDLAEKKLTDEWIKIYEKDNIKCISYNSNRDSVNKFISSINEITEEFQEKYRKKGFYNKQIRAMIVGIPNVGKSTFINNLAKRKGAATGDRPGVTKTKQWIKIKDKIDLLDTPGILWPRIDNDVQGYNLAATGAIKEEVLNKHDISLYIIKFLNDNYTSRIPEKYGIEFEEDKHIVFDNIAKRNGCILKGNEIDFERTSRLIISDFRSGKLGKITLERP